MTSMLASVADLAEARLAAAAGVDLIDLKNPARGALGALDEDVIATIRRALPRAALSATIGDLPLHPETVFRAAERTAACGVDYVKIGLFPGGDLEGTLHALAPLAAEHKLIAVLMADYLIALPVLERIAAAGFHGAMLDTADKRRGPLTRLRPKAFLARFVERAGSLGLLTGLAGSLRLEDVDLLLPLAPDYLGFRGALCREGRTGTLDPQKVALLRERIRSQELA